MTKLDLHAHRHMHLWRVAETDECVFLIDVDLPNPSTTDMRHLLEIADRHHQRVRAALNIDSGTIKNRERQRKVNVWLYSPEILERGGLITSEKPRMFYGTANAAGLHLVTHEMAWDDPIVVGKVLHEVVHLWWADQVGEAPSLLNEGVAVYFECILGANAERELEELRSSWQEYAMKAEPGFLRRLCKNDVFWAQDGAGEPVYKVGSQLVSFLLDAYGMSSLQEIFLSSHFNDTELAEHIESVIGVSIDHLEQQLNLWQSATNGK